MTEPQNNVSWTPEDVRDVLRVVIDPELDINIVDLYGDRKGEEFVLIGQVQVPKRWDIRMLQADLEQMGEELGFTVKLQHENIFVATNQLRLTPSPQG